MTTDLDLRAYHNGYKEWIKAMIKSKDEGEVAREKEERPKIAVAKSTTETLRATAESLK